MKRVKNGENKNKHKYVRQNERIILKIKYERITNR